MSILRSVLRDLLKKNSRPASRASSTTTGLQSDLGHWKEGGNILCFTASSEGNALAELTREAVAPLKHKASRIEVFDLNSSDWSSKLKDALREPVWFAAGAFGCGQNILAGGGGENSNLWESSSIPFVRFFGDTPAYFPDRHAVQHRNSINTYFDPAHADFYRRWFRDRALSVVHSPFVIDPIPIDGIDSARKLSGKVIFPKNGNAPGALIDYWRGSLPSFISAALEDLAEDSIGREWINIEPCFDDRLLSYFDDRGLDISADPSIVCFLVAQLDDYVRRVKSTMIAESLLDLPIIIRGRFWDHINFTGKRATYDQSSDFAGTRELIDQAPALIDMSPNTQHAPHDRILRAIGRGTAFLTNRQKFLESHTLDSESFIFDFDRDSIRSRVEHYVTFPQDAIDLGIEQSRVLRAAFHEGRFVDTISAAVQTMALRLGGRPHGTQNFVDFPSRLIR